MVLFGLWAYLNFSSSEKQISQTVRINESIQMIQ